MRTTTFLLGLMGTLACLTLSPRPAQAGIGACGDIHVEAMAECVLVPPTAGCEGMCTPLSVRAACSASLAADCRGDCTDLPSVDCSGSCMGDCMGECTELEAGSFDCQGSCEADCSGRCEASCQANEDQASCEASCQGSCGASCEGSCVGTPPMADCEASCEASCDGSCEADANFDCQIRCQTMGYADCETDVQGGCELECDTEAGALFCDGEYVDHGDNLDMCIAALEAAIDIEVDTSASGSAGCTDGDGCRAEGMARAKISSDCAVSRPGRGGAGAAVLWGSTWWLLAGLAVRRRRT